MYNYNLNTSEERVSHIASQNPVNLEKAADYILRPSMRVESKHAHWQKKQPEELNPDIPHHSPLPYTNPKNPTDWTIPELAPILAFIENVEAKSANLETTNPAAASRLKHFAIELRTEAGWVHDSHHKLLQHAMRRWETDIAPNAKPFSNIDWDFSDPDIMLVAWKDIDCLSQEDQWHLQFVADATPLISWHRDIVHLKSNAYSGAEIKKFLCAKYNRTISDAYISTVFRNACKAMAETELLLVECARENLRKNPQWRTCTKCGMEKPHTQFKKNGTCTVCAASNDKIALVPFGRKNGKLHIF